MKRTKKENEDAEKKWFTRKTAVKTEVLVVAV